MISQVLPGYVRDVAADPRSSLFPFQYQKMRNMTIFCMLQYMISVINEDPGVWAVSSDITEACEVQSYFQWHGLSVWSLPPGFFFDDYNFRVIMFCQYCKASAMFWYFNQF